MSDSDFEDEEDTCCRVVEVWIGYNSAKLRQVYLVASTRPVMKLDQPIVFNFRYLGEVKTFTPTQVFAMMLSNMKEIATKNLNDVVHDCCIAIRVYFTDLQRRAVLDAATIAGLHPLRLLHETTATALAYGIYKTDLSETDPLNVAFVDIGHASMQFKEEYKIDVLQNARACLRLRAACEKMKKMLSANFVAPLNIECLMDEKDVKGIMKRDEFEELSLPILERVKGPLEKALADAGLSVDDIHMVEVVGSGSRVPAINKILIEFFKKEPRRTMNASECVAKGAALQCAILSPTFKVQEFQVNESFPFSISLAWKGSGLDAQDSVPDNQQNSLVFPKGNPIPSIKALTFYRSGTFSIDVQYSDVSGQQTLAKISTYTIGPFDVKQSENAKVKVKVRLNVHGIVFVDLETLLKEEEVEASVSKEWILLRLRQPPSASFIARMTPKRRKFEPTPAADHPSHSPPAPTDEHTPAMSHHEPPHPEARLSINDPVKSQGNFHKNIRKEHRLESDDGREYTRGDMYGPSHKRNNGSFVNAEAQKNSVSDMDAPTRG
ncbi:hypothetical protein P8452_52096 [Trifolium repens]|nr:hypothetical protein P8452_52096 [Trifolium repens]